MSTGRGKIGRLTAEARAQVNRLIRDNRPAEDVIALCGKLGVKGVTPQNVSAWKAYGYQEWERRQHRLEEMASRREFAVDLAEKAGAMEGGIDLASNAAAALAVDAIQAALEDFDVENLKGLLAEKPDKFVGLVESLSALRKGDQEFVKLKMAFETYRARVRAQAEQLEALADGKGAASKEDLKAIAKELYGV